MNDGDALVLGALEREVALAVGAWCESVLREEAAKLRESARLWAEYARTENDKHLGELGEARAKILEAAAGQLSERAGEVGWGAHE